MPTDPTEDRKPKTLATLVMAGLPKQPIPTANTTLNLLIQMENNAYSSATVESTAKALKILAQNTDLNQPNQVKNFIAHHQCSNGYKKNLCLAYNKYCEYNNIPFEMPKYRPDEKHIKVPTKEKIEMLIAHAGKKMSLKLQLSMETGLRPIELANLTLKDIDLDQKLIYPTTAKHGKSRTLKISNTLTAMLKEHVTKYNLQPNDKLFKITARTYSKMFRITRNTLADKLHDPTLKTIRLYDLRHWFATNLFRKTNNILIVKEQLGHRQIENTMIYTHLLNIDSDEFEVKGATNVNEATKLIENGFEYVTEIDGTKLFRKRK